MTNNKAIDVNTAIELLEGLRKKGVSKLLVDDYQSSLLTIDSIELQEVFHSDGEYFPDSEDLDNPERIRAAVITFES